jgi:toxin ParE1/3/4
MTTFTLTKRAMADLVDIGRYTQERWGQEQRNKYLSMLDSCFQQLAESPTKGKDCSDIRHDYRKINVGSHVVFYRQKQNNEIEIVRVLHGRMDIETKFSAAHD